MENFELIEKGFLIEQKNLHYFAWTGGDHNPIHFDEKVAKDMNLPGVIAHGMYMHSLAMGRFENYLCEKKLKYRIVTNQCKFSGMALLGMRVDFYVAEKKEDQEGFAKYLLNIIDAESETKLCSLNLKVEITP